MGIGAQTWRRSIVPLPAGPFCGTPSEKTQAAALKRFYVLLMAFPLRPTRAQWQARFKPLVDAAITFDHLIVSTYGPYAYASYPGRDLAWLHSIRNAAYGSKLN